MARICGERDALGEEPIAYAADREEMLRLGGIFFDVAAEADDEIVYGAGVGVFVEAPDVFEDGFARDSAAFAAD